MLPIGSHNNSLPYKTLEFEDKMLFEGKVRDLSQIGNLLMFTMPKKLYGLVGRKLCLYKALQLLLGNPYLNITGQSGVGKTYFISYIALYLSMRTYLSFKEGIFYFDLKHCETIESLKEMFIKENVYTSVEKVK